MGLEKKYEHDYDIRTYNVLHIKVPEKLKKANNLSSLPSLTRKKIKSNLRNKFKMQDQIKVLAKHIGKIPTLTGVEDREKISEIRGSTSSLKQSSSRSKVLEDKIKNLKEIRSEQKLRMLPKKVRLIRKKPSEEDNYYMDKTYFSASSGDLSPVRTSINSYTQAFSGLRNDKELDIVAPDIKVHNISAEEALKDVEIMRNNKGFKRFAYMHEKNLTNTLNKLEKESSLKFKKLLEQYMGINNPYRKLNKTLYQKVTNSFKYTL